jgi:hypothetical protein
MAFSSRIHRSIERGRLAAPLRRVELAAEGFAALADPLLLALRLEIPERRDARFLRLS